MTNNNGHGGKRKGAERTLKQQRGIREEAAADRWVWRQWIKGV